VELISFFLLGFMASSVIGVAVAWMLGLHHPEPVSLDEESRVTVPYAEGKVSWLRHAGGTTPEGHSGWPSHSEF
jgi:hypothetical protein